MIKKKSVCVFFMFSVNICFLELKQIHHKINWALGLFVLSHENLGRDSIWRKKRKRIKLFFLILTKSSLGQYLSTSWLHRLNLNGISLFAAKKLKKKPVKNLQSKQGTNTNWDNQNFIISKKYELTTTISFVGLIATPF